MTAALQELVKAVRADLRWLLAQDLHDFEAHQAAGALVRLREDLDAVERSIEVRRLNESVSGGGR